MSEDTILYTRDWLNSKDAGGTAFISTWIDSPTDSGSFGAEVNIGDCYRKVTLDFYVSSDQEDRDEIIRKARLLKRRINGFCDALIWTIKDIEEGES